MSTELAEIDYLRELAGKLAAARHGEKGKLIQAATTVLSCSPQEVHRRLKNKVGVDSGRKTRSDKGTTSVPEAIARKAAGMVHVAQRANGKKTMAIRDTLPILNASGHGIADAETGEVMPIQVSDSTLARAMRLYNCHPEQLRQPTAHINQQSLHPNHVWQIDASVCVLFYLPKGGLAVMEAKEFYKNKPQNLRRIELARVIRYVVTDHYSGAFYVEYVLGAESAENLIQCFLNAIQKRGAGDLLHGVPLILMMDAGAANTSGLFKNLLERLGIEYIIHLPGNPRANGSVEKANDIIECKFEGRLSFFKVQDLAELNSRALLWRNAFHATAKHSRHRRTRNDMWLTIREEQLRLAPALELCRELVSTRPVEVTVRGNLTVSHSIKGYGSNDYSVRHIPDVLPKQKLTVVVNPYRAPCIDVLVRDIKDVETVYTVEPMQKTLAGFYADAPVIGEQYSSHADSPAEQARKQIRKQAYGVDTEREVDAKRKAKAPAYEGEINAFADVEQVQLPEYLPRRGTELGINIPTVELRPLNLIELAKRLQARMGDGWQPSHYQWLAQRYPDGAQECVIDSIVAELAGPNAAKKQALTLIQAGGKAC
jgi:transposase InsO family protein